MKITNNILKFPQKINKIQPAQYNNPYFSNAIKTDSVSFSKKYDDFETKNNSFKKEMGNYILFAKEINKNTLQKIVQKYSKDTKIQEYIPEDDIYTAFVGYEFDDSKKDEAKIASTTLNIAIPKQTTKKDRFHFAQIMIHEGCHVMQQDSDDREKLGDFFKKELKNSDNPQKLLEKDMPLAIELNNSLPIVIEKLLDYFQDDLLKSTINNGIDENISFDELSKEKGMTDRNFYSLVLSAMYGKTIKQDIDMEFQLKFLIYYSKMEAEAYMKQYEFIKENLPDMEFDIKYQRYFEFLYNCAKLRAGMYNSISEFPLK